MIQQKTILIIIIFILLAAGQGFTGVKYLAVQEELTKTRIDLAIQKTNEKILDFTILFVAKVLKAEQEIDFETRLKLENAVRNLGDEEILAQWQKFVESKTETEAQQEVKNLLEMLVNRVHPVK